MERAQPITMHLEEGEALDVTPGVYLSVIRELPWLGESKAGREKVVFPVRLTEPPFEEVEGEVHSGIRVAARILGRLGVSVQVQGRAITFDPVECLDKQIGRAHV